jgi:RNA 2',3'-cyclic 3'-phosphodiesterase
MAFAILDRLPMRIFVGLDIEEQIRQRIATFMDEMRGLAPAVRWVAPESLHVTLKFIGEKPDGTVTDIQRQLNSISANTFSLSFRGCGFFPSARSARVFWVGIESGPALAELAQQIENALAALGIPKEARAFSPHLTLARHGSGAPGRIKADRSNQRFARLREKLAQVSPPDFGTMTAHEFFLYRSQLSGQGSRYTKVANFTLHSAEG